eukprot:CAMPEP_0171909842 /NCGR_PEP_ID=MMETSP0993-20121228/8995_1 /TAXON_ID=483369 /ORGANISM="non described non described, Strain CCMP2098" /LENGTH=87 /DNA_ID=CAMNT_0012542883 /DNA_START=323 /DNA_END=582 /DNA_ORIENTATION=-
MESFDVSAFPDFGVALGVVLPRYPSPLALRVRARTCVRSKSKLAAGKLRNVIVPSPSPALAFDDGCENADFPSEVIGPTVVMPSPPP